MANSTRRKKQPPIRSAPAVETLLRRFQDYLEGLALKPATVRNYAADIRGFCRWLYDRAAYPPSAEHFREYRQYLVTAGNHSTATVNRRLQALRVFGRCLHEAGETPENPAGSIQSVRDTSGEPSEPRVLDYDEIERLVVAVRAGARPSLMRRDYAIIELMLQAGLRVNEVAALELEDIVLTRDGMRLVVRGEAQDHYREVPLNETLARALREYLPVRPNVPDVKRLFVSQRGRPLSMRSIQRLVESYAEAAQLDGVCANSLRHTCAKKMLDETKAPQLVAQWLGHKRVESLNRYR